MKMNKKGFTLIEMLVVIAIIAVLVSIVIPVVGNATEKAKEAADVANIRSAIAEVTTYGLTGEGTSSKTITMTQTSTFLNPDIGDIGGFAKTTFESVKYVTIAWDATNNCVTATGSNTAPSAPAPSAPAACTNPADTDNDNVCDNCKKAMHS